jgi:hypothetical protein
VHSVVFTKKLLLPACQQEMHDSLPSATNNYHKKYKDVSAAQSSVALNADDCVSIWFDILLNSMFFCTNRM